MEPVFIDTWGWLALLDDGEAAHAGVLDLLNEWAASMTPLYTSWPVVTEVCGAAASSRGRQAWGDRAGEVLAREFFPQLKEGGLICEVLSPSTADWQASLEIRGRHASVARLSLVDCTIPVLCQARGITRVLSGDSRHLPAIFPKVVLLPGQA